MYNFTCVNNTSSNDTPEASNTSYSFSIYLFNQIYQSDDDDYKNDISTDLYYWPYPTPSFKLATVKASDSATNTAPVRMRMGRLIVKRAFSFETHLETVTLRTTAAIPSPTVGAGFTGTRDRDLPGSAIL